MIDFILRNLEPILRQIIYLAIIILILAFFVRPLLNYFAVNREIEQKRKLQRDIMEIKDQSSDNANESFETSSSPTSANKLQHMAEEDSAHAVNVVKKMLHED